MDYQDFTSYCLFETLCAHLHKGVLFIASFIFITVIKEEASDSRAEVKSFDHGKLKHVETAEKNPLPTQADIKEELRPDALPDVSAVKDFDTQKLKHVETQEKTVMPTADG